MLRYTECGTGSQIVVVLHEWLGCHRNYDEILALVDRDRYRWIFVDLRGYGLSESIEGRYDLEEAASDIAMFIRDLQHNHVHLLGHSMSGLVVQEVSKKSASLLESLVLVAPVPISGSAIPPDIVSKLKNQCHAAEFLREAIQLRTSNRQSSVWLDQKVTSAQKASVISARRAYVDMFIAGGKPFMQKVTLPTLLITGKYDIDAYLLDTLKPTFEEWFDHLHIRECPESGHYPMLESPTWFVQVVQQFLLTSSAGLSGP